MVRVLRLNWVRVVVVASFKRYVSKMGISSELAESIDNRRGFSLLSSCEGNSVPPSHKLNVGIVWITGDDHDF
jgi:hypothetical protein